MAECLRNQLSSHSSLVKTHVAWQEEQIKELQQSVEESSFCNKDIEQVSNVYSCIHFKIIIISK